jgi:hypothetical protein
MLATLHSLELLLLLLRLKEPTHQLLPLVTTLHSDSPLELLLQRLREPTHQHQLLPLITTLHSDSSWA